MKLEDQLAENLFKFNIFISFRLTDFVLNLFLLCLFWTYTFLAKKLVLANLTEKKIAVTSVIIICTKICKLLVRLIYDQALF